MASITLTLELPQDGLNVLLPVLMQAIDEDTSVGLRVKPEHMAEHTLAPEVFAHVLALGNEEGDL